MSCDCTATEVAQGFCDHPSPGRAPLSKSVAAEWAANTGTHEEKFALHSYEMDTDPFLIPAQARQYGLNPVLVCQQWRYWTCELSDEYEDLL